MIGSGWVGLVGSLAVTFGLLLLAVHLLRRVQTGRSGSGHVPIRVHSRFPVGPKQSIAVVQVADRVLVVSLSDSGMRLLTELAGEARREALESAVKPEAGRGLARLRQSFPIRFLLLCVFLAAPIASAAQSGLVPAVVTAGATVDGDLAPGAPVPPTMPEMEVRIGSGEDAVRLTGAVGLVVFIGLLTLLPILVLMMTSFTRILIVLQFIRPALGTQTAPPMQLLVAVAVLLTGSVMAPVLQETHDTALRPYFQGEISQAQAFDLGIKPFRQFMLANTREVDLELFVDLSGLSRVDEVEEIPTLTLASAFITSELRTAFQMGVSIFLPFVVLDVIVASILMSLGMFMLPPMMISLPFKLLLFVLADGWNLMIRNLVTSFRW